MPARAARRRVSKQFVSRSSLLSEPVLSRDHQLPPRSIDPRAVRLVGGVSEVVDSEHEANPLGDGRSTAHANYAIAVRATGADAIVRHVTRAEPVLRAGEIEDRLAPEPPG